MCSDVESRYDFFYYKEHLFIVSELLRENLYEFGKFIRESEDEPYFTLPNLKKIARQVLEALAFVHSLGIIHCDVKPENIVIRSYSRCEVKLIDFGSSCFATDRPTTYIQSRSYRAPEVILGLDYDGRIDVWSLGCVLAEMLTGYVLFQNDSVQTMLSRIQGVLGPFPERSLALAKDTAKYMTPNNIVYERVRMKASSKHERSEGKSGDKELEDEGEQEEEEEKEEEEQYRYLVVYPKHTTLKHRLHCRNRLFVDLVECLLGLDHTLRPTAAQALTHPWLMLSDDRDEAELEEILQHRDEAERSEHYYGSPVAVAPNGDIGHQSSTPPPEDFDDEEEQEGFAKGVPGSIERSGGYSFRSHHEEVDLRQSSA